MREETKQLWLQAKEEMKIAKEEIEREHYFLCAFLCQQAIEKVLKAAVIEENKQAPPKTHDLRELVLTIKNVDEKIISSCLRLNPHYVQSRYPDAANGVPYQQYDEALACELYEHAKSVFEYFRKRTGA